MTADRRAPRTSRRAPDAPTAPSLELVACIEAAVSHHALPAAGELSLGRAESSDVPLDDPSVSRHHAVLRVAGDALAIQDLGSTNGTRVRRAGATAETADLSGDRVARGVWVDVAPGDYVYLGSAVVVVRPRAAAQTAPAEASDDGEVVVRDRAMRELYELATRIAASPLSVLLLGETGVGKEVLAEAIHARSPRAPHAYVRLNCAALSETLLESELFGHEKGAFTGAAASKPGLLETAAGGTVFLDEVGELSPALQVKLLRVLEQREVLRVGGLKPRPIDVRFISATNRDLDAEVAAGRFRQDLLFRLNGVSLTIPPLRERLDELVELAQLFARRAARQLGRAGAPRLSPEAVRALMAHRWPGNIRELRNAVQRAVVLCAGDAIAPEHLLLGARRDAPLAAPLAADRPARAPAAGGEGAAAPAREQPTVLPPPLRAPAPSEPAAREPAAPRSVEQLKREMEALERQRLIDALAQCGGNQTRAAAVLGISRRTLVTRLREYNIPRPRSRDD